MTDAGSERLTASFARLSRQLASSGCPESKTALPHLHAPRGSDLCNNYRRSEAFGSTSWEQLGYQGRLEKIFTSLKEFMALVPVVRLMTALQVLRVLCLKEPQNGASHPSPSPAS